jgi:hypothetical protein
MVDKFTEQNRRFPFGKKEDEGFVTYTNAGVDTTMPPGILSMTPLGADPRRASPYQPSTSERRPAPAKPHRIGPHDDLTKVRR